MSVKQVRSDLLTLTKTRYLPDFKLNLRQLTAAVVGPPSGQNLVFDNVVKLGENGKPEVVSGCSHEVWRGIEDYTRIEIKDIFTVATWGNDQVSSIM